LHESVVAKVDGEAIAGLTIVNAHSRLIYDGRLDILES